MTQISNLQPAYSTTIPPTPDFNDIAVKPIRPETPAPQPTPEERLNCNFGNTQEQPAQAVTSAQTPMQPAAGPAALQDESVQKLLTDLISVLQKLLAPSAGNQGQSQPSGDAAPTGMQAPQTPLAPPASDDFAQTNPTLASAQGASAPASNASVPSAPAPQTEAPANPQGNNKAASDATNETNNISSPANQGSVDPSKKALNFTNESNEDITIKFTPNPGSKELQDVTLKPGESMSQEMPEGWAGNIRKSTNDQDIATLGEFKFGDNSAGSNANGANQTYYDVSLIEGYNGNMTITPSGGGRTSGSSEDLLQGAPESVKAKDADGNTIGINKTTVAEQFNSEVVDYLRTKVDADESYVVPKDDLSTLGTQKNQLDVTFH